eukprot:TRINITY_DN4398_c0_g1_i1.p1 TRINITY_DN4398_c0_g1~~TRINITY_DN4398_c0_g1_i1.p1  ORF type:complete len:705 (-),score=279.31 TRINITY_DN4398_c0_g1_i1:272-2212(-)
MEKSGVPEVLADVLRRYDIVLFQEIRDSSQTAIFELVDLLNEEAPGDYSVSVSERLGRTSSKEQYAFVYRVGKVALISAGLYSDPGDVFEREPYFATFRTQADFEFTLVGLHSKPDDAVAELNRMGAVRDHVADLTGNDNIVLLGDFNADCDYVRASEFADISIFNDDTLHTYIATGVDTTTGNSHCAYDRFVVTQSVHDKVIAAGVFHFDTELGLSSALTSDVSDHYPIYLVIEAESLPWETVYETDFEGGIDSVWSDVARSEAHTAVAGRSGTTLLGRYGEDDFVRLILPEGDSRLPPQPELHEWRVSFLLHVIGSWNGRPPAGPDSFKVLNDLKTVFETSFCNGGGTSRQDFPNALGKGSAPCKTGSLVQDTLGYGDGNDATYRLSLRFFLDEPEVRLRFSGRLLASEGFEALEDESWALDEVQLEWAPHDCTHSRKRYCTYSGLYHAPPEREERQEVALEVPLAAIVELQEGEVAEAEAVARAGRAVAAQVAAMIVVQEEYITLKEAAVGGVAPDTFTVRLEMYAEHAGYLEAVVDLALPELQNTYIVVADISYGEEFLPAGQPHDEEEHEEEEHAHEEDEETQLEFVYSGDEMFSGGDVFSGRASSLRLTLASSSPAPPPLAPSARWSVLLAAAAAAALLW